MRGHVLSLPSTSVPPIKWLHPVLCLIGKCHQWEMANYPRKFAPTKGKLEFDSGCIVYGLALCSKCLVLHSCQNSTIVLGKKYIFLQRWRGFLSLMYRRTWSLGKIILILTVEECVFATDNNVLYGVRSRISLFLIDVKMLHWIYPSYTKTFLLFVVRYRKHTVCANEGSSKYEDVGLNCTWKI